MAQQAEHRADIHRLAARLHRHRQGFQSAVSDMGIALAGLRLPARSVVVPLLDPDLAADDAHLPLSLHAHSADHLSLSRAGISGDRRPARRAASAVDAGIPLQLVAYPRAKNAYCKARDRRRRFVITVIHVNE